MVHYDPVVDTSGPDPFAVYRRLRDDAPVYHNAERDRVRPTTISRLGSGPFLSQREPRSRRVECMFERLLVRLSDLERVTERALPRTFTGITSMPVEFSPVPRAHRRA